MVLDSTFECELTCRARRAVAWEMSVRSVIAGGQKTSEKIDSHSSKKGSAGDALVNMWKIVYDYATRNLKR